LNRSLPRFKLKVASNTCKGRGFVSFEVYSFFTKRNSSIIFEPSFHRSKINLDHQHNYNNSQRKNRETTTQTYSITTTKMMKKLFGEEKFEASKLKSHLKMAQTRISLLKNKKRNAIKLQQRQIADLLKQSKDESARIKVENVIREDFMIEVCTNVVVVE
jgi:transcription initiation factor IIF auxiliary subunit